MKLRRQSGNHVGKEAIEGLPAEIIEEPNC